MRVKVFAMSLVGMIFIILSPVWSYWTAMGGFLLMILGGIFILIGRDIEYQEIVDSDIQAFRHQSINSLKQAMKNVEEKEHQQEPAPSWHPEPPQPHQEVNA